jgi:serine/alanine adding enzyme
MKEVALSEFSIVKDWSALLLDIPVSERDVYFSVEYLSLYESEVDSAECFVFRSGDDLYLLPYLKRSHRIEDTVYYDFETAYGYGGPLSNSRDPEFLRQAEQALCEACSAADIVAGFVRFSPWLKNHDLVMEQSCLLFDRKTVAMDLSVDETEIWTKQIHSKHRNVIRKAEREGLTFEVDADFKYMDAFISLYRGTMARLVADDFYFFTDEHFRMLAETLRGAAFLGVVFSDGKIVSAAIFLHSGMYGHYHLSGSDAAYQYLAPNNFMLHRAALHLKEMGVERFHLGGGNDGSEDNSLLKFKRRFSPDCLDFYIGKFVFHPHTYNRVCMQWEQDFPEKIAQYGNRLLKYRY